jgi:hypothetical protein
MAETIFDDPTGKKKKKGALNLEIDDESILDNQPGLGGIVAPPISPYAAQSALPPPNHSAQDPSANPAGTTVPSTTLAIGEAMDKTNGATQSAPVSRVSTSQPVFGNRAGTGATEQRSMGAGMRASSGNNLATNQPTFGNRAGTGASQRGSMGGGMRASSGNNLATDQPTFGNRAGTGASETGQLSRAKFRRMM